MPTTIKMDKQPDLYTPQQLTLVKYCFLDTFGKQEAEEAAARLLNHSKIAEEWVGVKWSQLTEVLIEELRVEYDYNFMKNEKLEEERKHEVEIKKWENRNFWTFGLYSRFNEKPVLNEIELPEREDLSNSVFVTFGLSNPEIAGNKLANGLHELLNKGLIIMEKINEDDVFFPTNNLLEALSKFASPEISIN